MPQPDLYAILSGYTGKTKNPYVSVKEFLAFVEKYATRKAQEDGAWAEWAENAPVKFWEELPGLTDAGRCIYLSDTKDGRVFVPACCRSRIEEAYKSIESASGVPFPNELSLGMNLPPGFARIANLLTDMGIFFGTPDRPVDDAPAPGDIISLHFPQNFGTAILPAAMIPKRLMEISLLKVRHYLNTRNNKDYALNKLLGQMQGKEKILREIVDRIMLRPLDCLSEMERSADFPYLFWTYFCPIVKNDIHKKNEILAEDQAAMQAVFIIEVCCSFYRTQAAKKRESDAAFLTLEVLMDRPPWHYSLDDIAGFANDRGVPLLDIYSKKDLEQYIKNAVGESKEGALPAWLVVQGEKGVSWFVKKERYLNICSRMMGITQPALKTAIVKRWSKLIQNYSKEPSMESDEEFEKLLERFTKNNNPILYAILEDPKLNWACNEIEKTQGENPQAARIFKNGELLPYSAIFLLRRKELLSSIKLKLPFWHSIPILSGIIAFFKKLFRKNKASQPDKDTDDEFAAVVHEPSDLRQCIHQIETALLPMGKNIDAYLLELEDKWIRLIDKKARENLIIDLQSLLKDTLRNALKVYKLKKISRDGLREMSSLLVQRHSAFHKVRDKDALLLYMDLFMLKLLMQQQKNKKNIAND